MTILSQTKTELFKSWRFQQGFGQILLYVILSFVGFFILFPFYYMVVSSLREPFYNFDRLTLDLLPSAFNLAGYIKIFSTQVPGAEAKSISALLHGFVNTLFLEATIVIGSTFLNALAAYAFAKREFPGKQFLFSVLLVTIILPGEVTLLPKYVMFHKVGLLGTFWALILPSLTGVFGIFLIRQFMSTIPDALLEAARLDGASEFQVVTRLVMPLAIPAMATYALFTFLGVWNDLMGPLIFVNKPGKWTLQLALYYFTASYTFQYGSAYQDSEGIRMQTLFAGLIISALPTILIFVIFQRQLVSGITLTGLKG